MSEQIEGRNAVLEAFRSGKCVDKLFVLDGCQDGPVRTIAREARKKDTIINYVAKERLDQLSETGAHQGVIAQVAAYEYASVEDILAKAKEKGEDPFIFILDNIETGIALHGTEVKSLRMGKCSIKESFIRIENGEVFIYGMHISPYEKGNIFNKDPLRVRKLLLHKSEINKLIGKTKEKGMAIVPLKVYFKGSLVKVEIGLAKGKKLYDKRQDIAKKDQRREAERDFKMKLR